jgi:hypothetical protein
MGEAKFGCGETVTENHVALRPMLFVCPKNEFGEQAVEQLTGDRDTWYGGVTYTVYSTRTMYTTQPFSERRSSFSVRPDC